MNQLSLAINTSGAIVLTTPGPNGISYLSSFDLETAEWLRDQLFHLCARERARRVELANPPKEEP